MDILALSDLYVEPAVQLYIQLKSNPNMTAAQKTSLVDVYGKKFIDAENAFESNKKSMVQNQEYMRRLYRLFIALLSILGYVVIGIVGWTTLKNIIDTNKRINESKPGESSTGQSGVNYTTKRNPEDEEIYKKNQTKKAETQAAEKITKLEASIQTIEKELDPAQNPKMKLDDAKINEVANADLKDVSASISNKHNAIITALTSNPNANLDALIRSENNKIVEDTLQKVQLNPANATKETKEQILTQEKDIQLKFNAIDKEFRTLSFGEKMGNFGTGAKEGIANLSQRIGTGIKKMIPGGQSGGVEDEEEMKAALVQIKNELTTLNNQRNAYKKELTELEDSQKNFKVVINRYKTTVKKEQDLYDQNKSTPKNRSILTQQNNRLIKIQKINQSISEEQIKLQNTTEEIKNVKNEIKKLQNEIDTLTIERRKLENAIGKLQVRSLPKDTPGPAAPAAEEPAAEEPAAPAAEEPAAEEPAAEEPAAEEPAAPAAPAAEEPTAPAAEEPVAHAQQPEPAAPAGEPAAPAAPAQQPVPTAAPQINMPSQGTLEDPVKIFIQSVNTQLKSVFEYMQSHKNFELSLHKTKQGLKFIYALRNDVKEKFQEASNNLDAVEKEAKTFLSVEECVKKIRDIENKVKQLNIYNAVDNNVFSESVNTAIATFTTMHANLKTDMDRLSKDIQMLIDYDAQSNRILGMVQEKKQKLAQLQKDLEAAQKSQGGGAVDPPPVNVTRMAARVLENYSNVKTLLHCAAFLIYITIFISFLGLLITDHENYQKDIHDLMVPPHIPGITQEGTTRVLYQKIAPKKYYLMRYVNATKLSNGTKKAKIDIDAFMAETLDTIQYTSPMRRDLKLNQSVQAILGFISRDDNLQNDESYLSDAEMAKVVSDELAPLFLQQYIYLERPNLVLLDKTTTEQFAVSNNTDCMERCLYDGSCKAVAFSNNICFKNPTIQTVSTADPANGFTLLVKPGLSNLSIETASDAPATIPSTLSNYMDYFTKEDKPTNLVRTLDVSSGIYMTPEKRIHQLTHFKQTLLSQIQSLQDRFVLKKDLDYSILFETLRKHPEFKQDRVMAAVEDIIKEVNIQNQLLLEADPLSGIRKKYITFEEFKAKVTASTYKSAYESLLEPLYYVQLLTSETMASDTTSPAFVFYKRGIEFKKSVVKNLYNSLVALTVFVCIHISLQGFFKGFVGNPNSLSKKYNPQTETYDGPDYEEQKHARRDFFVGLVADYSFVLLLFISVAMFLITLIYNWQNKIENTQTYNERTIKHNQDILRSLSKDIFENAVNPQESPFVANVSTTADANKPDCKNITQLRDRCLSQTPRNALPVKNTHHAELKDMHSNLIKMLHSYEQCNISTLGSINKAPFPIGDILTYLVIILVCIVMIVLLTKIMQPSKVFTEIKVLMRNEPTKGMEEKAILDQGGKVPCKGDFDFSDNFLDSIVKIIVALIVVVFVAYIIFIITASADRTRSALYVSHQAKESRCTDQ